MLSLHCPNCGGTNIFDETKTIPTYCGFCKAHLPDMTQFVKDSVQLQNDQKRLDMYRQKRDVDMQVIDRETRRNRAGSFIEGFRMFICLLLIIFAAIVIIWANSRKH